MQSIILNHTTNEPILLNESQTNITVASGQAATVIEIIGDEEGEVHTEITLEDHATLSYFRLQNRKTPLTDTKKITLNNHSHFYFFTAGFGESDETLHIESQIKGTKSVSNMAAIYYSAKSQNLHYTLTNKFIGRDSQGFMEIKGISADQSRVKIDGLIHIGPKAGGTNTKLDEHSLIIGKKAHVENIPGLEILTNDVKATHASTISRVNDDELFYLNSRGIESDEARALIIAGFLRTVIATLKDDSFKQSILDILAEKNAALV